MNGNKKQKLNKVEEKPGVERFRRIKEEEIQIDPRVTDNSFEAKVSGVVLKLFFSLHIVGKSLQFVSEYEKGGQCMRSTFVRTVLRTHWHLCQRYEKLSRKYIFPFFLFTVGK